MKFYKLYKSPKQGVLGFSSSLGQSQDSGTMCFVCVCVCVCVCVYVSVSFIKQYLPYVSKPASWASSFYNGANLSSLLGDLQIESTQVQFVTQKKLCLQQTWRSQGVTSKTETPLTE